MITRRRLMGGAGAGAVLAGTSIAFPRLFETEAAVPGLPVALPQGTRSEAVLEALPGKKPLIKLTYRPPNYETPIEYFRTPLTPNDAFFVRYHLADIPEVDAAKWRLAVGGDGANGQTEFTLDDIKKMPAAEIVAVNQCSGNRRGLFEPHVAGVEWGYGAMGCARWKGARLKDILDKVGIKKEAIEIVLDGADGPVVDKTPDFVKSIPVAKAMEETSLVAYEMNGQPLPHFNGRAGPHRFAGLDRHLLDETREHNPGGDQAVRRFLDDSGLSRPDRQISACGALHLPGNRSQYPDHGDRGELAHHQPP